MLASMAQIILKKVEPYSNVIWDWNGTLLNDAKIGTEAEAAIFRKYGLPVQSHEERIKNFFMPVEKYYEKMGFDLERYEFNLIAEEWLSIYERLAKEAPLFDGVQAMLDSLKKEGKCQYVLSAAPELHLRDVISKFGIHHYFDGVYGLPNARADSKVARGRELLADFEIDPRRTILIGDTAHDFEVGEALDVDVLLIADGHHAYEALLKVHDHVLETRFDSPPDII
jgi:phosphoglycolate phosphatase